MLKATNTTDTFPVIVKNIILGVNWNSGTSSVVVGEDGKVPNYRLTQTVDIDNLHHVQQAVKLHQDWININISDIQKNDTGLIVCYVAVIPIDTHLNTNFKWVEIENCHESDIVSAHDAAAKNLV